MSKKAMKLKSKKGMSLVELLCAIVIMAIVVSCSASGLAVSYRSIILGGEQDKASARAQEYCDVIMTTVQETPSNEPGATGAVPSKNMLFLNDVADTKHVLKNEVKTYIEDCLGRSVDQVSELEAENRVWKYDDAYYYIKVIGTHDPYIDYEIKVYTTYGGSEDETTHTVTKTGSVTTCKGTVSKKILAD